MAIALDSSDNWDSSHSSPVAGSVPVGAGLSNSILVVVLSDYEFEGSPSEIIDGVSSDQDGAFTQVNGNVNESFANAQMWYLLNPTAATHSITISYGSSATDSPTSAMWHIWTGVDQTTPFGTPNSASGNSDSPSVTVTTASGEVVVDIIAEHATRSTAPGADQTEIQDNAATAGSNTIAGATSYQAGADGGVMSWTLGSSTNWAILAAPLKPAAAATATTPRLVDGGLVNKGSLVNRSLVNTPMKRVRRIWKKSNRIFVPAGIQLQGAR